MLKQNISKILDTEMERKDFLKLLGVGAVAAIGISGIIKAMTQTGEKKVTQTQGPAGYGAMAYGGSKDARS